MSEETDTMVACPFCRTEFGAPDVDATGECPRCRVILAVARNEDRARALVLAALVDSGRLALPAPVEIEAGTLRRGATWAAGWCPEELLSSGLAAKVLGLRGRTLRQYAAEGRIEGERPGSRNWKFRRAEVQRFLQKRGGRRALYVREGSSVAHRGRRFRVARKSSTPMGDRVDLEPVEGGPPALGVPIDEVSVWTGSWRWQGREG